MSFSSDVKDELYEVYPKARHCQIAETAGIASILARMEPKSGIILIETENIKILNKFFTLLKQTIKIDRDGDTKLTPSDGRKLRELLKTDGDDFTVTKEVIIEQDCCRRSFLRGVFLAAGSVSDPNKSYHFEIAAHTMQQAEEVQRLIDSYECDAHIVERKGHYVVYLKEGSQIVTMLGIIGAPKALMEIGRAHV